MHPRQPRPGQVVYRRYVALGDSQTEGLWDGNDTEGLVGFADRLAAILAGHSPSLGYANLAVRGKTIRNVLDEQLPQALSLSPDLVTVCVGMNDAVRPGRSFDRALADLQLLYTQLANTDITVVVTTLPEVAKILPIARLFQSRLVRLNHTVRTAAERHGFLLVDAEKAPSLTALDTWSPDRIHASSRGHALFAAAAAEALALPGSDHEWARSSTVGNSSTVAVRTYGHLRWIGEFFLPWLWRHARGRSSGDGRTAKLPRLQSPATLRFGV